MENFNPFKTSELFDRHAKRWQMELDASEFTLDVAESGTWLDRFGPHEHADDYDYRVKMSCPLDMCRDGVRIRVDNLWRTKPSRTIEDGPYADIITRLVHDADGSGTPLDAFLRQACWDMYVTGVDIVTQCSSSCDLPIRTRADQLAADLRPWFMRFTPLSRPDWAADESGMFLWARYCLGDVPQCDERQDKKENVVRFLTLSEDYWRIWAAKKDYSANAACELVAEGANTFDSVPIIKFYFSESRKPGQPCVPLSLLTRPAMVAKAAMNIKSQADADLIAAVTRWMLCGAGPEDLPESFAPGSVWKIPSPEAKLQVAQGSVGHIAEKRQWLGLYLTEILRLLKFRGSMAEMNASAGSGIKLALERTDFDNELRATASRLEKIELEMMRQAVSMATGHKIAPEQAAELLGYSVVYNRDYVLEPVGEILENIRTWISGCQGVSSQVPEITREMLRQLNNILMPTTSSSYKRSLKEIDTVFERPDTKNSQQN